MNVPSSAGGFGTEHGAAWYLPADLLERAAESALPANGLLAVLAFFRMLGSPENGSQAVRAEVLEEALNVLFDLDNTRVQSAVEEALGAGFLIVFEDIFLPGTPRGRDLFDQLQSGLLSPGQVRLVSQAPLPERPNIFRLYEANIGPLTPMMADMLKADALEYPAQWIEEAVSEAVERNIRNWRYVRAILKTWKEKGREERPKQTEGYLEKYRRLYQEQRRGRKGD